MATDTLPHQDNVSALSRRSTEKTRRVSNPKVLTDLEKTDNSINVDGDTYDTPVSPERDLQTVDPSSPAVKRRAQYQLFSLYFVLFLAGWDGGTPGPLIPRMQEVYNVNYTVVSMMFVTTTIGTMLGACTNVYLTDKFGFGKVIVLGSLCQVIGYAIIAPAPPFAALCVGFFIDGIGISLQDSQSNGFVASLKENSATKMGLLHAAYGLGAMISPLAATQFAQIPRWSFHFLCSCGIAILNTIFLVVVFRGKTQDECLVAIGQPVGETGTSSQSKYRQILSQKVVHLLALFSLIYVGVEVTVGGWTITYVIRQRGGGPSSGYISTGFFGGLTLGRVCLLWLNQKIGEYRAIFVYSVITIGLELVVWLTPSLVGDAIAVSFVGFFFGPMYPILMNESGRLVPPWLLTGSIGWIGGFGFSGAALFPFITGALASRFGIESLQPFVVALMVAMFVLWALVPLGRPKQRPAPVEALNE